MCLLEIHLCLGMIKVCMAPSKMPPDKLKPIEKTNLIIDAFPCSADVDAFDSSLTDMSRSFKSMYKKNEIKKMVHKKRLKSVIHAGWKRKKSEYPHKESNLRILRSDSLP